MMFISQETEIKLSSITQVLYFYEPQMPFHSKMLHVLSQIEKKHKNIAIFAIDAAQFTNQCARFSIDTIPSLLFFQNGEEAKRIVASVKTQILTAAFDDICLLKPENGEKS
jgi:hypothetical protein